MTNNCLKRCLIPLQKKDVCQKNTIPIYFMVSMRAIGNVTLLQIGFWYGFKIIKNCYC